MGKFTSPLGLHVLEYKYNFAFKSYFMNPYLQAVNTEEEITVKMEAGVDEQIEAARRDAFCEVRKSTFVFRGPFLRTNPKIFNRKAPKTCFAATFVLVILSARPEIFLHTFQTHRHPSLSSPYHLRHHLISVRITCA